MTDTDSLSVKHWKRLKYRAQEIRDLILNALDALDNHGGGAAYYKQQIRYHLEEADTQAEHLIEDDRMEVEDAMKDQRELEKEEADEAPIRKIKAERKEIHEKKARK